MAQLRHVNFKDNGIMADFSLSSEEYATFREEKEFILLPISSFDLSLVTGTLGNSNRIMLPNKILKKHEIETLIKNASSKIVKNKKGKFLVIKLDGPDGIPKFGDERHEKKIEAKAWTT